MIANALGYGAANARTSVPGVYPCAACDATFPSAYGRHSHELFAHYPTGWRPSAELQAERTRDRKRRYGARHLRAAQRSSNHRAVKYGHAPIAYSEPWPYGPCVYCGGAQTGWDHVVPLARGGSHLLENLVPAFKPCNSRKYLSGPERVLEPRIIHLRCDQCGAPIERGAAQHRKNLRRGTVRVACSQPCRNALHAEHMRGRAA